MSRYDVERPNGYAHAAAIMHPIKEQPAKPAPTDFVGFSSDPLLARRQRRGLIARQARAMAERNKPEPKRRRKMSDRARANMSAAAQRRQRRELELRGLDPPDTSIEHAGNPDHEIDQLPDTLTEDR